MLLVMVACLSTIFGYPGDGHGGRTPTVLFGVPVRATDVGIAHRTWPVGSVVRVESVATGKVALGLVLDRGPYGKIDENGKWFNARWPKSNRKRRGKWKGCADLTPALGSLIGHNGGRDLIKLRRVRWRRWLLTIVDRFDRMLAWLRKE